MSALKRHDASHEGAIILTFDTSYEGIMMSAFSKNNSSPEGAMILTKKKFFNKKDLRYHDLWNEID